MGTFTLDSSSHAKKSHGRQPHSSPPNIPDHALLRVIGEGSYGEVWLARNILGQFRAAKVIYRRKFEKDRPFEREFEGIKQFEPLSRTHDSQVDILHVGRNDQEGYFYYVMELADDANPENQDWESYAPRTLRKELKKRDRLEPHECIDLGLALSNALEVLHQHGLVHRDIKPSNIIFIGGVPKLADIGLVTKIDDAGSMVGTYGYLPPEGASSPQADIYSLGMVLYEASTGYKPSEFPQPLATLKDSPDPKAWVELNAIILRACARDVRHRYQSAEDLSADLCLVRDGKSVRTIHALRERLKLIARVSAAAVFVILAGLGMYSLWKSSGPPPQNSVSSPAASAVPASSSPAPHIGPNLKVVKTLEMPGVLHWPVALIGKWQRYREPLLFLPIDQKLVVISSQGYRLTDQLMPLSPGVALNLNFVSDIDGDGSVEAVVSGREGEDLFISVLNSSLVEVKRFKTHAERRPGKFGDTFVNGLWAKRAVDLKGDGKKQMLTLMGTAYIGPGRKPREVLCFDYESQEPLWKYEMGPFGIALEVADLDGDGVKEIVVGTEALSNGNIAGDGTDDNHSYLFVLRHDGRILWKAELGGIFTRTYALVTDLDGTGTPSVFAWVKDAYEFRKKYREPEDGKIVKFDLRGTALHQYDAGLQLVSCRLADVASNGTQKILATDRDGFLHVLDSRLSLVVKMHLVTNHFDRVRAEVAAITDLDRDGKNEIIVTSIQEEFKSGFNEGNAVEPPNARVFHENCILVLNSEFQLLARYLVAEEWNEMQNITVFVADFTGNGGLEILSLADKALVLEYESGQQSSRAAK